jgi:hypothetical protein
MSSSDPPAAATVLEVMLGAGKATALARAGHTVLGEKPRIKSALFRVRLLPGTMTLRAAPGRCQQTCAVA